MVRNCRNVSVLKYNPEAQFFSGCSTRYLIKIKLKHLSVLAQQVKFSFEAPKFDVLNTAFKPNLMPLVNKKLTLIL